VSVSKTSSGGGKWLGCLRRVDQASLRLICFSAGGAGPSSFWPWASQLRSDIELWAICFPGRERRSTEACVTAADAVVDAVAAELTQLRGVGLAFYGHSLGAGLAYQIADRLRGPNDLPRLLILSGRMPPHYPCNTMWTDRSDDELLVHLLALGGIPPELLQDRSFASVYLPRIRADLKVNESLRYGTLPPVDAPITIINGNRDTLVEPDGVLEWCRYTNGKFEAHTVSGSHFFMHDRLPEVMSLVSARLDRLHDDDRTVV
jgi:surfactin synthase thioesterase subunit